MTRYRLASTSTDPGGMVRVTVADAGRGAGDAGHPGIEALEAGNAGYRADCGRVPRSGKGRYRAAGCWQRVCHSVSDSFSITQGMVQANPT